MTSAPSPTVPEVRGLWLAFAVIVVYAVAYPLLSPRQDDVPLAFLYQTLLIVTVAVWMFTRQLTSWMEHVAHGTRSPAGLRGMQRWRTGALVMGVLIALAGVGDLTSVPWRGVGGLVMGSAILVFAWLSGPVIVAVDATATRAPDAAATLAVLLPRWTLAGRLLQVALVASAFVAQPSFTVPLFIMTLAVEVAQAVSVEAMLRFVRARA